MDEEQEQLNLYTPLEITDPNLRDVMNIMNIPIVSISKKKRIEPIEYHNKERNVYFKVEPNPLYGAPTIYDFDILIYITSILNECINNNQKPSRYIEIVPNRLFSVCGWVKKNEKAGGYEYDRLNKALDRLKKTSNITNIRVGDYSDEKDWSWITEINRRRDKKGKYVGIKVVIAEWLYNAIINRKVLSIHKDYFKIKSGTGKYLYRIIRKMAGSNKIGIRINLKKVYEFFPEGKEYKYWKREIMKIIQSNDLPEYVMEHYKSGTHDILVAVPRDGALRDRKLPRKLRGLLPT